MKKIVTLLMMFLLVVCKVGAEKVGYIYYTYNDESGLIKHEVADTEADEATVVTSDATQWNTGWYVVKEEITISSRVAVNGNVHLILKDGCSLTVNGGINVAEGNSFAIYGQSEGTGKLIANGGSYAAGIGGQNNTSAGVITINGGIINAKGGGDAAGIGGGKSGSGGEITINGGNITAEGVDSYGGTGASGIGGGDDGSGGIITINGGEINSIGKVRGAGIGGGRFNTGGKVVITGGKVTATGGSLSGAGIGGGYGSSCGSVTITGGEVIATGGGTASGIGCGSNYNYTEGSAQGSITISGGKVTATGGGGFGIGESGGTFSTGESGNAFIITNGISDSDDKTGWSGIFFEEGNGSVYGDQTLTENVTIGSGNKLTIDEGASLTIAEGGYSYK